MKLTEIQEATLRDLERDGGRASVRRGKRTGTVMEGNQHFQEHWRTTGLLQIDLDTRAVRELETKGLIEIGGAFAAIAKPSAPVRMPDSRYDVRWIGDI